MKKTVFLILAIAVGFAACDQDDNRNTEIPSVVLNGFTEQFPDASQVEWEKKEDLYEAEFELQNVDYEAILDAEGSIVKYKNDMEYAQLPQAVQATITADFDKSKVDDVEMLQISEETYYQVEFDQQPNDSIMIFEASGQVNSEVSTW